MLKFAKLVCGALRLWGPAVGFSAGIRLSAQQRQPTPGPGQVGSRSLIYPHTSSNPPKAAKEI